MKLYAKFQGGPLDGTVNHLDAWERANQTPNNPTADKIQYLPTTIEMKYTHGAGKPSEFTGSYGSYKLSSSMHTARALEGTYRYEYPDPTDSPAKADKPNSKS